MFGWIKRGVKGVMALVRQLGAWVTPAGIQTLLGWAVVGLIVLVCRWAMAFIVPLLGVIPGLDRVVSYAQGWGLWGQFCQNFDFFVGWSVFASCIGWLVAVALGCVLYKIIWRAIPWVG